jgi:hypothetical protein
MKEQEKKEIIKAINEIRKELNLEPYPQEELEAKDLEELRKLFSSYFRMQEEYKRKVKSEKTLKTGLLFSIPFFVLILFIAFLFLSKPKAVNPKTLPTLQPIENLTKSYEMKNLNYTSFVLESAFRGPDENYILIINNNGAKNVTLKEVLVDNEIVKFEVLSGNNPILPQSSTYLKILKKCDNSMHRIKIVSEEKVLEFDLQPC